MGTARKLSTEEIDEILRMHYNHMNQHDIAKALQISQPTVGYWLRKNGIHVGRGKPSRGGLVASTIPKSEYVVQENVGHVSTEMSEMAEKNAANACLLVEDRSYSLRGQVGTYEVSIKTGFVALKIGEALIELERDMLVVLADELKALARNVVGMEVGCEMW